MIDGNWYIPLSEKEKQKYELNCCKNCAFYPCECVEEYTRFREKHSNEPKCEITGRISDAKRTETWKDNTILIPATPISVQEKNGGEEKKLTVKKNCVTNSLSYDREELQSGCIMGPRYVIQVECGRKTVTDGIGDHYKIQIDYDYKIVKKVPGRWEPKQSVIISAQTGQGKNYFIESVLLPFIESLNYQNRTKLKILIISNRLALKCQIGNHIRGEDTEYEEDSREKIYSYNDVADVMTYQGLLGKRKHLEEVQSNKRSKYIFVVCDEAHFFTSDAGFNPYTQKILSAITDVFKKVIRIYMTATPYECLEQIYKYENLPVFYHFKRDYSYLDVRTYSEIRELYGDIIRTVDRKEKWLIFIDDKEKCQKVKNELEEKGEEMDISLKADDSNGKIYAISADSKKDDIYNSIIYKEKLVKGIQVLITTSVLDNGVNLAEIDNIVISDMSKVKCLQMVGRARINGSDDKKKLFIKRFNKSFVEKKICDLKEQRKAYHDFDLAYGAFNDTFYSNMYDKYRFLCKYYNGDEKDWKNAKHWFGRLPEEPDRLFSNLIAIHLMEKYLSVYENIFQEMQEEQAEVDTYDQETKKLLGQKYLEYQLSWFGKIYCVENDITLCSKGEAEKKFLDYLKLYSEEKRCIDDQKKEVFKKEFTRLHDAVYPREDKNKTRIYGINLMNKILEKRSLNYRVESKSKYWKVVELIMDSEKTEQE